MIFSIINGLLANYLFINSLLLGSISIQLAHGYTNQCSSKTTCQACIQTPSCAWCYDPAFTEVRCFQPSFSVKAEKQCKEEFVHNPDNILSILSNLNLTKAHSKAAASAGGGGYFESGYNASWHTESSNTYYTSSTNQQGGGGGFQGGEQQIVQVAPQRLNLKLRARQSYSIYMSYTQAEDYPVDLYYLMDLSRSMLDDKEKLSLLGDQLAQTMKNITLKFTLGFGSFVDKVVMPYVSTLEQNLRHPCDQCAAPYGYRNMMRLSKNTNQFSAMVKQAQVSGNLDGPEGGFDAIMQAVVCRRDIGWREKARRLLVFSTDASFHYAGDGKLGGIVKPNDGQCHLSRKDEYLEYYESQYQDYPSIEQINTAVKANSINVIFAVTKDTIDIYEQLAKHVEGASVAKLEADSSNIVELIKEQYEQISSSVEMKHNASSAVSIRFFTKCLNSTGPLVNTNKCGNIKVGDIINFKIEIEIHKCPKLQQDRFQTIQIYPVGINESLIIDLEMLCGCDCEQPGDKYYEENAAACHMKGTYKCGVCECNPGASGKHCECHGDDNIKYPSSETCIKPNTTNGIVCSGRGTCVCGRCECFNRGSIYEVISGEYCECDNFSCERHNGELCSGTEHGTCECGECRCKAGWSGPNCACQSSDTGCYMPGSSEPCSGNGKCECGVCECTQSNDTSRYWGKYCEKCPTCPDKCLEFRDCVQCKVHKNGPLYPDYCSANCTIGSDLIAVDKLEAAENEYLCHYTDEDHCQFTYVYYYDADKQLHIRAEKNRKCPPKVFVLGIIFGVIAAIVLVGMAFLLLWKLYATIHDRREFAKFEKERMMAKWDTGENPIYKQATSTFKNPTYAGKS